MKEVRNLRPPEWQMVTSFYQLWAGQNHYRPTKKELNQATELLATYGQTKAQALLPLVVKRLKEQWPDAKTFAALVKYVPEVHEEYERKHHVAEREKEEHLRKQMEEEKLKQERRAQSEILAQYQDDWTALPDEDRAAIEEAIRRQWPHVARVPTMFERYCIIEYARQCQGAAEESLVMSSTMSEPG